MRTTSMAMPAKPVAAQAVTASAAPRRRGLLPLVLLLGAGLIWAGLVVRPAQAQGNAAKAIYDSSCSACHATGVIGAPKFGDAAQWGPRAARGVDALVKSAIAGTPKGMPPKGGRADLSDAQMRAVVDYMLSAAGLGKAAPAAAAKPAAAKPAAAGTGAAKPGAAAAATSAKPAPAAAAAAAAVTAPAAAVPAPAAPAADAATATAPATAAAASPDAAAVPTLPAAIQAAVRAAGPKPTGGAEVNAFNRLLKPIGRYNRPAVESGIHDPTNDMTLQLQPPQVAFAEMVKSPAGNHVDWVKSLDSKAITPRWDRLDPAAPAVVMDLNIVREVKGSMPDVVYPHKQHTEWLDCSNCHPAIFIPQKGANQISMASILLGQKCGVCHGKVAFPVSECRLCHSRKKAAPAVAEAGKP
ncbi:MAG: c-type cytochrome [Burkholderiales bacterium]|nr:c-type cytochrome [Burkholderiales bacterium]